jgi:RNA polymerase sigma factor (sigma-70 family)
MAATQTGTRATQTLDRLYRAHAAEVYRYAYAALGNRADAEDVTQTTFVNALRALERGETPRTPSHWLITIAHNIVRQRFRQQQVRPVEVTLDRELATTTHEDEETQGPSLDDLVRALQRIPPTQREALVLRELEGRSYREIAEIMEISTSALETLLFRARRSLAEELENLVTCERAELALSRQLDDRLSRKERRRLHAHLSECPSCARFHASQAKHRRAFRGLALLPLPLSLTLFKGAPSASAATGLSTIGAGGAVAAASGTSLSAGGGAAGGLLAGGVAVKVAAVVTAVTVAGGVTYEGVQQLDRTPPAPPPRAATVGETPAAKQTRGSAAATAARARAAARGNKGAAKAHAANGQVRRAAAPGQAKKAQGSANANGNANANGIAKRATPGTKPKPTVGTRGKSATAVAGTATTRQSPVKPAHTKKKAKKPRPPLVLPVQASGKAASKGTTATSP